MSKDDKDITTEVMMMSMGQMSQAMYKADKKLAEMLEDGRISKDDRFALWEQIQFVQDWIAVEVDGRYGEGTHDKLALKFGVNERRKRIESEANSLKGQYAQIVLLKRKLAEATKGEVDAKAVSRIAKDIEDRQGALEHWKDRIPEDERDEVLAIFEKVLAAE